VAIGLDDDATWWRVDWNTLLEPGIPIALFTMDTGPHVPGTSEWPADAGVRSDGIDRALLLSGTGAWLVDPLTGARTRLRSHFVDKGARSFAAVIPRRALEPSGAWAVRLAAGLANDAGDGFADVEVEDGALPSQPNVYNLGFRAHDQEPPHLNFWSDKAQAAALTDGDVSAFSLGLRWSDLAARRGTPEPLITGPSTRWFVSSLELGQGVTEDTIFSTDPQFLARVQPYSICIPPTYAEGGEPPLTLLLHSLALGQNQFAAISRELLRELCNARNSIVVTPLARGPASWYFDEGELDVWEVWARVREQLGVDPNRTVIGGYSMGATPPTSSASPTPRSSPRPWSWRDPPRAEFALSRGWGCQPTSTPSPTVDRRATACTCSRTRAGCPSSFPTGRSTRWCRSARCSSSDRA